MLTGCPRIGILANLRVISPLETMYVFLDFAFSDNLLRPDPLLHDDGNVYVIKADLIRSGDRYGKKIGRKIISRWENQEIDDEFDFWIAENILNRGGIEECII